MSPVKSGHHFLRLYDSEKADKAQRNRRDGTMLLEVSVRSSEVTHVPADFEDRLLVTRVWFLFLNQ